MTPPPKLLLGVVHLPPTPGASGRSFERLYSAACRDAEALAAGGVDGIMIENFGDAPFHKGTRSDPTPPDVVASLAVVARDVGRTSGLPVGVNCLRNDGMAALGAAAVAGARWVRVNVLSGSYVTDQGLIDGEAARLRDYRRQLGWSGQLLADVWVKHAAPLGVDRSSDASVATELATASADLAQRSGADGVIVTGARTGAAVDAATLRTVRGAVQCPVWIGSGLTAANAAALWPLVDGAIVGTALKAGGDVAQPVDSARVAALRDELARV